MKPKMFVTLHSPEEIREFCRFCNQFDDTIDLLSGQMITDAKSLMGSLMVDYSKPIEVVYQCYDDVDSFQAFKAAAEAKFTITYKEAARTGGM